MRQSVFAEQREPKDGKDDEHDTVANESAAQGWSLLASVRIGDGPMSWPAACLRRPQAAQV